MSSLLFVPATDEKKFKKATGLNCEGIILDLEDAVHENEKSFARKNLASFNAYRNPNQLLYVRINALHTTHCIDDLNAVIKIKPNGLIVPKAEKALDWLDLELTRLEQENGLETNSIKLILILETAYGITHMDEILSSSKRIESAAIGMADLATDLGTSWEDVYLNEPPLFIAQKEQLALVSRSLGLQPPWDSVYMQFKNIEGFKKDAMIGKRLGFQGKHVIHPSQIDLVNEIYGVSESEYLKAKELIASMDGKGAIQIDGLLVDEPVVKRAKQLIEKYERELRI